MNYFLTNISQKYWISLLQKYHLRLLRLSIFLPTNPFPWELLDNRSRDDHSNWQPIQSLLCYRQKKFKKVLQEQKSIKIFVNFKIYFTSTGILILIFRENAL